MSALHLRKLEHEPKLIEAPKRLPEIEANFDNDPKHNENDKKHI
jgi:hypothetical protein